MPATFDLDTVPKPSRYATLQDLMTHVPVPIDVRMSSIDRLHVSTVSDFLRRYLPDLVQRPRRGGRPRRNLVRQDHARTMMLSVVTAGTSRVQQGDTVSDLRRGDVVGYSSAQPYRATFDDVSKHTYMIDYEALGLPDQVLHAQLARRINAGHALGIIVARYLTDLGSHAVYLPASRTATKQSPTSPTAGDSPTTPASLAPSAEPTASAPATTGARTHNKPNRPTTSSLTARDQAKRNIPHPRPPGHPDLYADSPVWNPSGVTDCQRRGPVESLDEPSRRVRVGRLPHRCLRAGKGVRDGDRAGGRRGHGA